jgi:hypothetical protein
LTTERARGSGAAEREPPVEREHRAPGGDDRLPGVGGPLDERGGEPLGGRQPQQRPGHGRPVQRVRRGLSAARLAAVATPVRRGRSDSLALRAGRIAAVRRPRPMKRRKSSLARPA